MKKKKKAASKGITTKIKEKTTEKKSKEGKSKITLKTAQKSKEIKKVKAKTEKKKSPLKPTKKVAKKKITEKLEKEKVKTKVKAKIKEKPKKVAKKIVTKVEKKPKKKIKKVTEKIEKKPKKEVKKVVVKKKEKPEKIIKKPEKEIKTKKVSLPRKALLKKPVKVPPLIERKPERVSRPVIEEKYPPGLAEILPKGYGEDSVTLMIVDPEKLFAYWEVQEDTIAIHKGSLILRVYDVTGVDFDGMNANSYVDIAVSEKIGSGYITASPEREFVVDIGFISPAGEFIVAARSNKVSTPRRVVSEEGVIPEFYEEGFRKGYEQ